MRLWSLHPCYLDPAGLVAVWREGLLARAVLRGALAAVEEMKVPGTIKHLPFEWRHMGFSAEHLYGH